jgi:hypothetical protein
VRLALREGTAACGACGATYREAGARLRQIDPSAARG